MAGTINAFNNQIAGSNSAITLNSGTNAINISTDASATTLSIGTGAAVKGVTIGSTNSTSSLSLNFGGSSGSTLSNYVTGTWTPALAFGGGTTGITYTSRAGYYTRIGNVVYISFLIVLSSKGSSTGAATITGLPVTTGSNAINNLIPCGYFSGITLTALYQGIVFQPANSGTTMGINQVGSAQSAATVADTSFANTSQIGTSGFYLIV